MFALNEKVTACKCDGMSKRIVDLFRPFFRLKILFASYYFFIGCHAIQNMERCRVSRIKSCLFDVCGFINNKLNTFNYGRIPNPLPLGRYFVTEVSAPKYYQLSGEKMEAEIEYPSQIIKLSAYNKPATLGVTIKKSGNYEVQSGQTMSYDFSGIANTSNVVLNHFFWHDRIPTDATRALSISTGTYNARLYYKVTFKTNLNDYRTLASNLLTSNNYSLSLNAATLRLVQGEYVTDVRFEFGTVPSGFSSVVKPTMRVQVLGTVSNGYQIINRADVGGQYLNEWQTAKTTWVTTVRRFNTTPLPKTGY